MHAHKQSGSTLITSMMFLLLISLLGLATANSSVTHTLIGQNITTSFTYMNDLQNTLSLATRKVSQVPLSSLDVIDKTSGDDLFTPNRDIWPSKKVFYGIKKSDKFIIEYLGCYPPAKDKSNACKNPKNTLAVHFYRLTAKTILNKKQNAFLQKTLALPHKPTSS